MDNNYFGFRKAKMGGFNKKDVISYIEKMRNDFFDYKKAVETTIEQLNAKIRELEATAYEVPAEEKAVAEVVVSEKSNDPLTDINEATYQLRRAADELCKNISDFIFKVNSKEEVKEDDIRKPEIFEDTQAYIAEAVREAFNESTSEEYAEKETDIVSKILESSSNFSYVKDEMVNKEEKKENCDKGSSILDVLSSAAFLK